MLDLTVRSKTCEYANVLARVAAWLEVSVSSQVVDEIQAFQALTEMISTFGAARTVSWLAEIVEQRSDAFLRAAENQKAAENMRAFRILQKAAVQLRD